MGSYDLGGSSVVAGKGSKPRPIDVDRKTYESNWDRIFNKDKNKDVRVQVQDSKSDRRGHS